LATLSGSSVPQIVELPIRFMVKQLLARRHLPELDCQNTHDLGLGSETMSY